ncbi:MAG: glycosyltransferase, partial [Candidatus Marinimicrobia bacterium]|nr:glycosyltransferase [Candidatus Neomarinimicrobiota bacterium]
MKLFIVPSWYPTTLHPESGSFFADRAQILQTGGHEVTVITAHIHSLRHYFRYRQLKRRHANPENDDGLTTYRFETVNPWPKIQRRFFYYYCRQLLRLWDLAVAERGKPDVAVINSSLWAGTALADRLEQERIPFVVSEHLKEFLTPGSFTAFQNTAIIKTYRSAARIVATSSALKKGIALNFPQFKEKIHIIANPVDTEIFQPDLNTSDPTTFTFVT